jgi:ketosteroid isomerase-like protein
MSQENVELVHRGLDAFNRRDLDALLALCDPDVEFFSRVAELEGGGPYRGHDGMRSWWQNFFGVWLKVSAEIEDVRDAGDVTVTRMRFRGHGIESEAPWEQTQWQVAEWRQGKVIRLLAFLSEADALEAADLRE